ncbi:class I SAM-dependent methyltransferase, partial [Mesorhizobium sp. M1A.F.Ca.IN.020.32.1.1]|uniref:class I SAM-dependent methyltransferase n=1 Tax=Mesorhizobium sp. M1A.F.Ca.IN.020.32.1.1 TaxID=2496763 RepID=UPI000FD343F7
MSAARPLENNHARLMDQMYRYQRYIYDFTRKYYLFGRDTLIRELNPPAGASVLEVGCGTGRNLALIGDLYPGRPLFGLDISAEMLATARAKLRRHGLSSVT